MGTRFLATWIVYTTMAVHTVEEEFQAKLTAVRPKGIHARPRGKIERKRYRGGAERLMAMFRNLRLPDGCSVEVLVDGELLVRMPVMNGHGRVEISSECGQVVPSVKAGAVAEIRYHGKPVVRGTFANH